MKTQGNVGENYVKTLWEVSQFIKTTRNCHISKNYLCWFCIACIRLRKAMSDSDCCCCWNMSIKLNCCWAKACRWCICCKSSRDWMGELVDDGSSCKVVSGILAGSFLSTIWTKEAGLDSFAAGSAIFAGNKGGGLIAGAGTVSSSDSEEEEGQTMFCNFALILGFLAVFSFFFVELLS